MPLSRLVFRTGYIFRLYRFLIIAFLSTLQGLLQVTEVANQKNLFQVGLLGNRVTKLQQVIKVANRKIIIGSYIIKGCFFKKVCLGNKFTRVAAGCKGCKGCKSENHIWLSYNKKVWLGNRVTRVTAGYKGCKSEKSYLTLL